MSRSAAPVLAASATVDAVVEPLGVAGCVVFAPAPYLAAAPKVPRGRGAAAEGFAPER